jgi:hypothetical protein
MRRGAFTLFELILAIALSATLLALIGTAVNLYLVRMDAGRTRVEEAQLARSILATIAADIRATTVYQTQDISSVEQLAQAQAEFDVDSIGDAGQFDGSALGTPGAPSTPGGPSGASTTTTGDSDTEAGDSGGLSGGLSSDGSSPTGTQPGLNGLVNELMLDVVRLPRLDEMYPTVPQQASSFATGAAAASLPKPSDLKSVRYFIRQGATVDASDPAATLLSPEQQLKVGGLVRQTVDRAVRQAAEQVANSPVLNSGQVLLAPEVTQIQFIYFDGTTSANQWDMSQAGAMPTAVDVRIWIAPDPIDAAQSKTPLQPRMYNQTVELPLAQAASSAAGAQQQSSDQTSQAETGGTGQETGGTDGGTGFGSESQL